MHHPALNATLPPTPRILSLSCRRLLRFVAAVIVFVSSALHADEMKIVGKPPRPTDEAVIRSLELESSRAVMYRDYATLERIWSERFIVNAPNNQIFASRAAVFEIFRRSSADLYSSYEKKIECIAFDDDLAIVMGVETVTPIDGSAADKPAQRRYTNVWRSANGAWRLIARQATFLPPDASSPAKPKGDAKR